MKFTANRTTLLAAVKTAAKIVSEKAPVSEITGLLFEADENNGFISLTGTDIRTIIQMRTPAEHIEESGSAVIKPIVIEMLSLLGGETVSFETYRNLLTLRSEETVYEFPFLDAKAFPKTQLPFPEDTIVIKGINPIIKRTVFAASKDTTDYSKASLQYVKVSFLNGQATAQASDGQRMAVAQSPHCADGTLEMIMHQKALNVLCSIIKADDELYVGIVGNFAVMMKQDMIFSTMLYQGKFMEVLPIMSQVELACRVTVDAKQFRETAENVASIFGAGDDRCIDLKICENSIHLETKSACAASQCDIPATDTIPTPEEGFHYAPHLLLDCLRLTSGPLTMTTDKRGFAILEANQSKYFLSPRGPVHIRVPEPKPEKKAKEKTAKTKSKTTKAAA